MSKHPINVQDGFLFQQLKANAVLAVELLGGQRMEGQIKRFDRYAIVLQIEEKEVLIYKHAIATVAEISG